MQAIIEMGGKQYKVTQDQVLYVELTGEEAGSEINITDVLYFENGNDIKIGTPKVENASVKAKVLEKVKAPKIDAFIYKNRKNYHKRWGHRQKYDKLQIISISA